jgi:hypothetical protein
MLADHSKVLHLDKVWLYSELLYLHEKLPATYTLAKFGCGVSDEENVFFYHQYFINIMKGLRFAIS